MTNINEPERRRKRAYLVNYTLRRTWWERLARRPCRFSEDRIEAYDTRDALELCKSVRGWTVVEIRPDERVRCRECSNLTMPATVQAPGGESASLHLCYACLHNPEAPPVVALDEVPL